jgi:hypothetical protein
VKVQSLGTLNVAVNLLTIDRKFAMDLLRGNPE